MGIVGERAKCTVEGEMGWELECRWEVWFLMQQDVPSSHGERRERRQRQAGGCGQGRWDEEGFAAPLLLFS